MPSVVMTVTGLDDLIRRIERAGKVEVIRAALKAGAAHIKSIVSVYPPSSEANMPNSRRWYQRGWGVKWMRADGTVNGYHTSETLGRRWTVRSTNYTATIGNNSSYAPYVHDPDDQAYFHAERGWKTTEQVAEDERETIENFIVSEIEKALR